MLEYVHEFIRALLFSVIVESVTVVLLCRFFKQDRRAIFVAAFGTLCTIPYVWFVFPTLFWYSSALATMIGEGFAFLFEAFFYKMIGRLSWRLAFLFSLVANAASYFLFKLL